jgi:uncharacterized repeat protein (TIGR01451 family)
MKFTTIFLLLFSLPISAATINVGSSATGCTLHDAIRAANTDSVKGNCSAGSGADLILVPAGGSVTLSSSLPDINTPMTISTPTNTTGKYTIDAGGVYSEVPGSIINANNFRIFYVGQSNNVTLENLIVTNSIINTAPFTGGAAIKIVAAEVNLNKVEVLYNFMNTGTQIGAGVRIQSNSVVNFDQCSFADNRLSNNTVGTANPRGGNIAVEDSVVSINDTEIKGYFFDPVFNINGGSAEKGAGIYLDNSDLTISNSLFLYNKLFGDNASDKNGGDIYAINNSNISVINSTFFQRDGSDNNRPRMYLLDSNLSLNNITLWGHSLAGGLELHNSTISSSNSLFVRLDNGINQAAFCHAYDSLGNVINFIWQSDINNLTAQGDTSCNITPLPPAQINFLTAESNSDYIEAPADNGGLTKTSRLAPEYNTAGDPLNHAINNGDSATCEATDQRGFARDACDIGAYELNDTADLTIDMSIVTPAPYYKGQRIEYAIDVSNLGPSAVYGADVFIDVSGLSINNWQTNHTCTLQNSSMLDCTISSLVNGGNTVIRLFAIKDATANFDGDATVQNFTDFSTDPSISNNIDNTNNSGTVVAAADLKITQTLTTSPPYNINQVVTYQIVLDNLGPDTANNIVFTHSLVGLTNTSYSGCNSSTATTCSIVALGNTQSQTITFTATINAGVVKNTLSVSANEFDPKTRNNTAKNKNTVSTNANLKLGGSITPSAPYFNEDLINFNYTLSNFGPDTATNIEIDFTTSTNLILTGASGACNSLPCTIASLNSGADINFSFQALILFPGQFSADILVLADQTDSDLSDNSVNITKTASTAVDLEASLILLDSPPYNAGNLITFEAKVKNNISGTAAASALIENMLLDNLSIVQVSSTNCPTIPCTLANLDSGTNNQEIIAVIASIDAVGDFTYTLKATATETETIYINNSATVTATAENIPQELIFSNGFE